MKRLVCKLIGHRFVPWWNSYGYGVECARCKASTTVGSVISATPAKET